MKDFLLTYIQMKFVGPLADHFILSRRFVVYLILKDVVSPRRVPILIENHRSPCASCETGYDETHRLKNKSRNNQSYT